MEKPGPRRTLIRDPLVFAQSFSRMRLGEAWARVLANGGAAGGDRVRVEDFGAGLFGRLADLARDLEEGKYAPGPLRRVMVPKKSGGERPLDIPCVRDRVAQTALTMTLSPLLDGEFEESSYGYRAGRSVQQAVRRVSYLRTLGLTHVVDADIKAYFENVPHDALMERLGQSMTHGPSSLLIRQWLEHWAQGGRGLAQGSPLSPLLANLYLDRLDEQFAHEGARIVRFADDFLILCRSGKGAGEALSHVERLLARQGLELNREKSRVTHFEAGFRFLGHAFVNAFVLSDPEGEASDQVKDLRALAQKDEAEAEAAANAEEADGRRRRARLDPGQRVLYLLRGGRRLSLRNQGFLVEESVLGEKPDGSPRGDEWRDLIVVHPDDVDRIEIGPDVVIDPEALKLALATGTEAAFVSGHGETLGWVTTHASGHAKRQLAQAGAALDPARKLAFAKAFVTGRLRNERALLRRLNRSRADAKVIKALAFLNHLISRVAHCPNIAVLRGLEGRAAALYWPSFGLLLEQGMTLSKRERDKANDPVNIMLNMTAWLLARDITAAVHRAGLHAGFGFLHEADDGRDALAYDLMEEFRAPLAEAAVASAINQRIVDPAMFGPRPGGSSTARRMGSEAQAALIRTYERFCAHEIKDPVTGRRRTWRARMTGQAIALAQAIEGGHGYEPVNMDY